MISTEILITFLGALVVVYTIPGPDMALVLQSSTGNGLRHGLAVTAGLATARTLHVTLSACGVAALLISLPEVFTMVRLGGGLYLVYVAWQIACAPAMQIDEPQPEMQTRRSLVASAARGMLSSLLNPKALLFCSVLLPQFIRPDAGAVWAQMLLLGVILVLTGTAFDTTLALSARRINAWLVAHPRAQSVQRWSFALILVAFAVRLAFI